MNKSNERGKFVNLNSDFTHMHSLAWVNASGNLLHVYDLLYTSKLGPEYFYMYKGKKSNHFQVKSAQPGKSTAKVLVISEMSIL